jgi:hypothetical protein
MGGPVAYEENTDEEVTNQELTRERSVSRCSSDTAGSGWWAILNGGTPSRLA